MESASVLNSQGSQLNHEEKVMTYFDVISLVQEQGLRECGSISIVAPCICVRAMPSHSHTNSLIIYLTNTSGNPNQYTIYLSILPLSAAIPAP
jgi:hypothetical protein